MKCKKIVLISSILAAISYTNIANAGTLTDSAKINFTGSFQSSTCSINLNNSDVSNNGTVELVLGMHPIGEIKADGESTAAVPFAVNFSNCGGITGASVAFAGTQTTSSLFDLNSEENNTAVGIGINTSTTAGNYIAVGTPTTIDITDGSGAISFYARYVKIGDVAITGADAPATVTMNVTYS
ncbi:fimbrial protein [Orbus wheelerorum]|uniref:fimbrial protein n=1 Tax=Orbus wheelerorum TaxID=3074111 RepID=UPI00370DA3B1